VFKYGDLTAEERAANGRAHEEREALRKAGQADKAKELQGEVFTAGSYDEALRIMSTYCDVY
jgi:hypothetical protein